MYELIQVAERSYYIQSPAKIGLVRPPYETSRFPNRNRDVSLESRLHQQ